MSFQSERITSLINKLSAAEPGSKQLKGISNPKLLIASLKDFNNIIGNVKVKDDIAIQIESTLRGRNQEQPVMLNTILYGPPGTGKTEIGKKLARIWYAIGCLGKAEDERSPLATQLGNTINSVNMEEIGLFLFALFVVYLILSYVVVWLGDKIGSTYAYLFAFVILLSLVAIGLYFWYGENKSSQDSKSKTPDEVLLEEKYFKVVSREDFVDKYVGWTDKKTLKLLESCLGKVIFIDEFYSLLNRHDDTFGMEALNTINRFMSERPGQIVFIIAGYKDQIINGPFAAQPGFERRFMWRYEMKGYSSQELYLIFAQQARKSGWEVEEPERVKKLFEDSGDCFPSFGGDTERLVYYSGLENTKDSLDIPEDQEDEDDDKYLTYDQIGRALYILSENNMKKEDKHDGRYTVSELMDMWRGGRS